MANERSTPSEIVPVTTLRFAAALYVFLFHIHIRWPLVAKGSFVDQFLMQGAVGMSLFFILSGFVLGYRFRDGVADLADYGFSRFTRIYPVYFIAALVTVPWLVTTVSQTPGSELLESAQYLFIVLLNVFMLQAWMPQLFGFWNNGGSWSISVEAFFYVIFPFVIRWFRTLSDRQLVYAGGVFYALSSLPGLASILFPSEQSFIVFYAIPAFRLGEFSVGVCAGVLFARGHRVPAPSVAFVGISLLTVFYLAVGPYFGWHFISHNYIMVPLLAAIISSASSLQRGLVYQALCQRWLVHLGHVSYSFYSFQALILLTAIAWHEPLVGAVPVLGNNRVLAAAIFMVLVATSSASFHLIETRLRRALHQSARVSSLRRAWVW